MADKPVAKEEEKTEELSAGTKSAEAEGDAKISVGEVKKVLALLIDDSSDDKDKLSYQKATSIIDMVVNQAKEEDASEGEQKEKTEAEKAGTESAGTESAEAEGDAKISVGKLKKVLALLVHDDKEKLSYKEAKSIIDMVVNPAKEEEPPRTEEVKKKEMCKKMQDLGLGRGIDATKPNPWQNKSSIQVREVDNVIETDESGQREYYEEEVNSVLTQQVNTNLTIEEPSNSLNIGVDAEGSRSVTETRKVVGKRVKTRTVAFRTITDEADTLEKEMSKWIVERILMKQQWLEEDQKKRDKSYLLDKIPEEKVDYLKQLEEYISKQKKQGDGLKLILQSCYDFIEHIGVTHYVHTVKLGAAKYRVLTTEDYYTKLEATSGFELNKVAKVEMKANASTVRRFTRKVTKISEIGTFKDDDNNNDDKTVTQEAVLEIELKPLHSLLKTRVLELATKWALERYIKRRESGREGPFLIACRDGENPIYWCIKDSEVKGTTEKKDASLFYVIQTDDGWHPREFYLGYVGESLKELELPKGPADPVSKIKGKLAPIPKYVTADLKMTGRCDGPLKVSAGAHRNRARFSLHNSTPRRMTTIRSKIDTEKWAEGGGFFINCVRRMFKLDGYIAMETDQKQQPNQPREDEGKNGGATPIDFKTACYTSIKKHSSEKGPWMVFRLLPGEHKEDVPVEAGIDERLTTPLVDVGKNPTYLSDERDFLYLFGDLSVKREEEAKTTTNSTPRQDGEASEQTGAHTIETAEIHDTSSE